MSDSTTNGRSFEPAAADLAAIAAAADVELDAREATRLAAQAPAHFALLRRLDQAVEPQVEPASSFRLPIEKGGKDV